MVLQQPDVGAAQLTGEPLVAGVDLLSTSQRAADQVLHGLVRRLPPAIAADCLAATHWARAGDVAHISLSVELAGVDPDDAWELITSGLPPTPAYAACLGDRSAGAPELLEPARSAAAAHTGRSAGRLVHFPGVGALVGTLPARQVLKVSAVQRVRVLAGGDADPRTPVNTRGHVRPQWSGGELVLMVQPAVGGTLVPFETPDPTPCCADHD